MRVRSTGSDLGKNSVIICALTVRNEAPSSTTFLTLPGGTALSGFRIERRLRAVRDVAPAVTALASHYLHFVESQRPLQAAELERLQALLRYGPRTMSSAPRPTLVVVPRF